MKQISHILAFRSLIDSVRIGVSPVVFQHYAPAATRSQEELACPS